MPETWLLGAAMLACTAGMGWLALAMRAHWAQVRSDAPAKGTVRRLRALGVFGLAASLGFCLAADHVSMAVLVWIMVLACSALAVAFTLSWRPRLLRPLTLRSGSEQRE